MKFFKKTLNVLILLILPLFVIACGNGEEEGPIPLDSRYTDELKLETTIEGKDFIRDGIGKVTLTRFVDGDTIAVNTGSQNITIRFLGIDTPETSGKVEPWGMEASRFVEEKLSGAYSIVLTAEGDRIDSTGNRYLAWVWYQSDPQSDYRLLNLEEIEMAYTAYTVNPALEFHDILWKANEKAKSSGKRIWGEQDPNFNYSKEVIETSILYILENHEEFALGTKFEITVRLARTVGNNMFLEDAYEVEPFETSEGLIKEGKGYIYAFGAYATPYYRYYQIGDVFTIECQLQYGDEQYGTQLTGLAKASRVIENQLPDILLLDANSLRGGADLEPYYGRVITLENLECVSIQTRETDRGETYYLVEFRNESNEVFDVYFGNSVITKYRVEEDLTEGYFYNITGGVAYYQYANGKYQISMGDAPRDELDLPRLYDVFEINN